MSAPETSLVEAIAENVLEISAKVRDSINKNRPADTAEYASALNDAAAAYREITEDDG